MHSNRTVLQPHRASATVETRLEMGNLVVRNLAAHLQAVIADSRYLIVTVLDRMILNNIIIG